MITGTMDVHLYVSISFVCWIGVSGSSQFSSKMEEFVELGKQQYLQLNEKTKIQVHGKCWKNAVSNIHEGCQQLTEDLQTTIALRFTDCFLRTSSHETCNCYEFQGKKRIECLQNMTDRAFNAYTEFYTHTQNICFYLKSQIWHEETEDTINRLSFASDKAANQMEELIDSSMNLKQALADSHSNLNTMMSQFQIAALEQQRLLFDVFDRLSSLQEWAVGEISWLDTVIFYLCGIVLSHLLTSTPRTQNARLFLFLAFTLNIIAERYLCKYFIDGSTEKIDHLNETLYWWTWLSRKLLITVCILCIAISVAMYKDYNIINHNLLVNIQQQNLKLLGYLERVKMLESSIESTIPNDTSVTIDSYDDNSDQNFQKYKDHDNLSITPNKLPSSPRTTTALLKKTEEVIQSALESSFHRIDVVHRSSRCNSPALSHISTRSSTSAESRRRSRQLNYNTENVKPRYNLRYMKSEEKIEH